MSDILQKLIPMFIGAEGSFSTPLMQEYTPYVDNKIVVNLIDGIEPNSNSAENDNEV